MQPTKIELDERAGELIAAHPASSWAIDYDVHRCCGGGKICEVKVRELGAADRRDGYVRSTGPDGTQFLIDPRAARRLPAGVHLTVRGIGRKHLDLVLTGDEWGELLYT